MNILFVCTLNHARSVAAERLYRGTPGIQVRSGGTDDRAKHQINEHDLAWADQIFVCEEQHETWIRNTFAGDLPQIIDLGIPDLFTVDDPRLIAELSESLVPVLGRPGKSRDR